MTKKSLGRLVAGIVASVVIFVLIVLAFGSTLEWPTSLATLGITVGTAWFFAAGVGAKIEGGKWSVALPTLLAIGLIASTLSVGIPWDLKFLGSQSSGENVEFRMEASFAYLGSENNLPIENVAIRFPCPNIENVALPTKTFWSLYYLDDDNVLVLEADQNRTYGFRGDRNDTLMIYLSGIEPTYDGPKIYYNFNKLYPREFFLITTIAYAPKSAADKVTLCISGDIQNRSSAHWQNSHPREMKINLLFRAQLLIKTDDYYLIIENFGREAENVLPTGLWLYPQL